MTDKEIEALAARVADMVAERLLPVIEALSETVGALVDMMGCDCDVCRAMDDADAAWEPARDKKEVLLD